MPSFSRAALALAVILLPVSLLAQGGGFGPPLTVTAPTDGPMSVAAADLDGDGDLDVLWAAFFANTVAWQENVGAGLFGPPQIIDSQADCVVAVCVADLDGDGDADPFAALRVGKINRYENLGGGAFGPPQTINTLSHMPEDIEGADVDGDGDIDILMGAGNRLVWYENLGNNTFASFFHSVGSLLQFGTRSVHAADLDGDNDLDVMAANGNQFVWFANQGGGTFSFGNVLVSQDFGAAGVSAGDVDGDGDVDIVSSATFGVAAAWYENLGNGSFGPQQVISLEPDHPHDVHAVDLDGDGDEDVLLPSAADSTVSWFESLGGGSFGPRRVISNSADGAFRVVTADVDGDGGLDVVSANLSGDDITWYRSFFQLSASKNVLGNLSRPGEGLGEAVAAPGDLDGDGKPDVVWGSPGWNGDRGRVRAWSPTTGQVLWTVDGAQPGDRLGARLETLGDVDGDGVADVVGGIPGAQSGAGELSILSGATGATISSVVDSGADSGFGSVIAAGGDWNGDGVPDFAVGAPSFDSQGVVDTGRVRIYSGLPPSQGTTAVLLQTITGTAVGETFGQGLSFVADRDGDGKDELIVAHRLAGGASRGFSIFAGGSAASLATVAPLGAGPDFGSGFATDRDLNGDGVPEILVGDETAIGGDGRTWLYDGATLNLIRMRSGASGAGLGFSLAFVGDLDGNGSEDYVLGAPRFFSIGGQWAGRVLLVDGATGDLLNDALVPQGLSPEAFVGSLTSRLGTSVAGLGDVDGDGFPDFAVGLGVASKGWVFSGLNPRALFSDCADGTAGEDLLLIDGSAGGGQRRVSIPVNTPYLFSVVQPSVSGSPAPFVIAGYLAVPTTALEFVLPAGLGSLCLPPVGLDPGSFLLTDNLTPSTPQLVPSTPTPWTVTNTVGLPLPFAITFQGLMLVQPGDLRVTNAIILDITP